MAAGKHFAEPLHTRQHQRGTVLAAALIAAQVQMLTDIFTLRMQALQLVDKLGGVHKAKIHPLPGQRMNSVGGIANQRQTMGGELTRVASGQRENLPIAFKLSKAKAIIKSDIQRLVKRGCIGLLHSLRLLRRQRPDDRAQMRIAKRQEGQNAFTVERLTRHSLMRLGGTYRRHQRMMAIVPEGQRNIGFITQPRIGAIGADHQPRGQHATVLQAQKSFVFAPRYLLQLRRRQQGNVSTALRLLPQRVMHHGILNNMAQMAKDHALVIEANAAKAIFVPHFHAVIAAGALGDDFAPDAQLIQ